MLTDIKPLFSGITGMEVKYSDIDTAAPLLSERVGLGMCLTLGSNITVLSQRNGDGSVRSYGFMRQTEDWARSSGIDWMDPEGAKRKFIQMYYDSFDQNAKDLILHADNDSVVSFPPPPPLVLKCLPLLYSLPLADIALCRPHDRSTCCRSDTNGSIAQGK